MRHLAFLVDLLDPGADGAFEVAGGLECLVGEVVALEVAPGPLDVVQFRGVGWQPLDGDPRPRRQRRGRCAAGVDGSVVEHQHHGPARAAGLGAISPVQQFQQADEVGAGLGGRGVDEQLAAGRVERADHSYLAGLAGRLDPQVGALLSPGMGQVGMRQRLALVGIQQGDVAGLRLGPTDRQAHAHALDRGLVLPLAQGVTGPAPSEPPFFSSELK